jgi:hypothetical protein
MRNERRKGADAAVAHAGVDRGIQKLCDLLGVLCLEPQGVVLWGDVGRMGDRAGPFRAAGVGVRADSKAV